MLIVKKLSDNSKDYLNTYYEIIDQMKNDMQNVEICNSISKVYIEQIIPHKKAAIALSENILRYTTNVDIENLAKNIISEHSNEIEKLENILETCMRVCNSERDVNLYMRRFNEILNNMLNRLNNISTTNNLNALYLNALIAHHEGGISLAQNALSYTLCPELKTLANEMIVKYTAQLVIFRQLLRNLG